jgi:hypothetical protein
MIDQKASRCAEIKHTPEAEICAGGIFERMKAG